MATNPTPPNPGDHDETSHVDDAVIGRAFTGSAIALVVLAAAGAGAYFLLRKPPAKPELKVTQLTSPSAPAQPVAQIPATPFADITEASGIRFLHNSGASGEKLLPETMGAGVAFLDYDNDGDEDILFANGTYWEGKTPAGKAATTPALYQNDGSGRFTNVTAGSGLDVPMYGMGIAVGDFDNDGLRDIFFANVGPNRLFRNLGGGKFSDVTSSAGVAGLASEWSSAPAWADIDNDGDLDLFVANYVRWSREIDFEVNYTLVGVGRAYGPPMNFQGTFPYLYRNEGGGRFTDISQPAGVQVKNPSTGVPAAKSLGVAPVDLNNDGYIDFVVANDTVQNFVFINQKNGAFTETGAVSGIGFDSYGNTRGAMGIDAARYRNDNVLGVAIGNFANEMTALYVSSARDSSVFTDEAIPEGIGPASRLPLKFGVAFLDYDLDGWLDLLSCNGHLEEEISKVQQSQHYRQPAQLFWNVAGKGGIGFLPVSPQQAGADLFKPLVGRGLAVADIDQDGDLDVVFTQVNGAPLLARNDQKLGHHWARIKLVGRKANRDAIGAWVRIKAGGLTLHRQVMPTKGYLSQSELAVSIGLGQASTIDSAEVIWPGGQIQSVPKIKVDGTTIIEQVIPQ